MPELPKASGLELVRAFEKMGFRRVGQRGSHIKMKHASGRMVVIPNHKMVKAGTLKKGILNPLGISVEELRKHLK